MPHASLPDNIDALKQLVIEQRALLAAQEEQLLSRDVLIEKLRIDLLRLKRMRFGRSSEQRTLTQLLPDDSDVRSMRSVSTLSWCTWRYTRT